MGHRSLAGGWTARLHSAQVLVCLLLTGSIALPAFAGTIPVFTRITSVAGLDAPYSAPGVYGPGVAVFDYDGDLDLDIFVPNDQSGHKLYRNNGDGTFTDIAASAGLNFTTELPANLADRTNVGETDPTAMMPNFLDTDGDGDLDFFLTCWNSYNRFFENVNGTYVDKTAASGLGIVGRSATSAWSDYDLDGDLDVYIADWGGPDHLFRNDGGNSWTDMSSRSGILNIPQPAQASWSATWFDHNGDLYPELYVGVDYGNANLFYTNQGGTFVEEEGNYFNYSDNGGATMGEAFGDYDHDGDYDIFVANSQVNDFYRRDGNQYFDMMSDPSYVGPGGQLTVLKNNDIGWFCGWYDFDQDSWEDLFLVNGYIRMCFYDDPANPDCTGVGNRTQPNLLWMNLGGGNFARVTDQAGLTDTGWGKSAAVADFDRDGDLDIFVTNSGSPTNPGTHGFWRNDTPNLGNWLMIELQGVDSNSHGIGAEVRVTANGYTHMRRRAHSPGYLSQAGPELHFGLGAATVADKIVVRWPSGTVDTWPTTPVNQRLLLREGFGATSVPVRQAPRLIASIRESRVELQWSVDAAADWEDFVISRTSTGMIGGTVAVVSAVAGQREYRWTDPDVREGRTYTYHLTARFSEGRVESEPLRVEGVSVLPRLLVEAARPNPFNPRTTLRFFLPANASGARLRIVDAAGRLVTTLETPVGTGWNEILWDGTDGRGQSVASGNYRFLVESGGQREATSLSLVR